MQRFGCRRLLATTTAQRAFACETHVAAPLSDRSVIGLRGADALTFLQGLVTSDVRLLAAPHAAQLCAFLDSKGRTLAEATLCGGAGNAAAGAPTVLVECSAGAADTLLALLRRYRLRARVELLDLRATHGAVAALPREPFATSAAAGAAANAALARQLGEALAAADSVPAAAFVDPRCDRLGVRVIGPRAGAAAAVTAAGVPPAAAVAAYAAARTLLGVPEGAEVAGVMPLEWGVGDLRGVSFDKGCYVGQELVARTHFRGLVRKRVVPVVFSAPGAPPRPPAWADPLTVDAAAAAARPWAPFSFVAVDGEAAGGEAPWSGAAAAAASAAAGAPVVAGDGARVGRLISVVPGTNLGFAMLRLERLAGAAPDAGAPRDGDDFEDDGVAARCAALHARARRVELDWAVGGADAGAPPAAGSGLRVTPVLPLWWRRGGGLAAVAAAGDAGAARANDV